MIVLSDLFDGLLIQIANVQKSYIVFAGQLNLEASRGFEDAGHKHIIKEFDFVVDFAHFLSLVDFYRLVQQTGIR